MTCTSRKQPHVFESPAYRKSYVVGTQRVEHRVCVNCGHRQVTIVKTKRYD